MNKENASNDAGLKDVELPPVLNAASDVLSDAASDVASGSVFDEVEVGTSRPGSAASRGARKDVLRGVHLKVRAELGRKRVLLKDALEMMPGSVIDLDKLAEDPVDLYVNDLLVARGEVLVVNDGFCVRITEVVPAAGEEES